MRTRSHTSKDNRIKAKNGLPYGGRNPEERRAQRKRAYLKRRETELKEFHERYIKTRERHKEQNRLHYLENGKKWKARRTEIHTDYLLAKFPRSMVEKTLTEAGIDVVVDTDLTTFQMFALLESLGIEPEDCFGFDSFKRRYDRYYGEYLTLNKKDTKKNTPK